MEETNEKKKSSIVRMFLIGFFTAAALSIAVAVWISHQYNLRQEEAAKNWAAREAIRQDSIAKANQKMREYRSAVKYLNRRDSVFASLKYVVGDIVFLKPDSIRGVVQNVVSDDQMDCFTYLVLCKNKDGQYEAIQRNIKLIY